MSELEEEYESPVWFFLILLYTFLYSLEDINIYHSKIKEKS